MADPISIGALVVAALAVGATEAAKKVLPTAAADAYQALKSTALRLIGSDVEKLEANPDSEPRQAVIAELVEEQPAEAQAELHALAEALRDALKAEGRGDSVATTYNQFINSGSGQQFNAPGGTQNFGAMTFGSSAASKE